MKKYRAKLKAIICLLCCILFINTIYAADSKKYDVTKKYDVVVCGAEPEGIAAAVSAARNGLSVLLVSEDNKPGGLYTSGMLSMLDLNYDDSGEMVNRGIFKEIYNEIGRDGGFDIAKATKYFSNLLSNNRVDTLYNITNLAVDAEDGLVNYITFNYGNRVVQVKGDYYIDSMLEAPTARKAGCDYVYGREDLGLDECACATLVFSLKGCNWGKIVSYLNSDNNPSSGTTQTTAWGYSELRKYEPVTDKNRFQLRGLNISREDDGSLVINAFQIFNVNALDEKDKKNAYEAAKKELKHVVSYMNKNAVGFENAVLDKVADELYIREGVRIIPEQTLYVEDAYQNKEFDNRIAYGSYPIDLQSANRDRAGGNMLISRNVYSIPMGTIIPKGMKNILVVGKSAGYDQIISGSARTVPVGIAEGQAAGVMCSVAKKNNTHFDKMYNNKDLYTQVQNQLTNQGAKLSASIDKNNPEMKNWSFPYIQNLRKQGFLSKFNGKRKTYACNEEVTYSTFSDIASLMYTFSDLDTKVLGKGIQKGEITKEKLVEIVNRVADKDFKSFDQLYKEKVIDYTTYTYINSTDKLYNSHAYALMSCTVDYLRKDKPLPTQEQYVRNDVNK